MAAEFPGWLPAVEAVSRYGIAYNMLRQLVADGVFTRAEAFLLRLRPGEAYRRLNWTFQPGRMLDKSMDSYATWFPEAVRLLSAATPAELAENVYLRVELQHLVRLETSGAVLFLIDTRLLSLAELARVPAWAATTIAVLEELPADLADYKGLADLGPRVVACLRSLTNAGTDAGTDATAKVASDDHRLPRSLHDRTARADPVP